MTRVHKKSESIFLSRRVLSLRSASAETTDEKQKKTDPSILTEYLLKVLVFDEFRSCEEWERRKHH